jgi:hypothetical protein
MAAIKITGNGVDLLSHFIHEMENFPGFLLAVHGQGNSFPAGPSAMRRRTVQRPCSFSSAFRTHPHSCGHRCDVFDCSFSTPIAFGNVVKRFAQTFRQRYRKVSARRRHWGQGESPASGVLTSKRYACTTASQGVNKMPLLSQKRKQGVQYDTLSLDFWTHIPIWKTALDNIVKSGFRLCFR